MPSKKYIRELLCVSLAMSSASLCGTTYTVTTTADNGNNASPTLGSLREALLNANANTGPNSITFNVGGNFVLPGPLPPVRQNLTSMDINGQAITLSGTAANASGLFVWYFGSFSSTPNFTLIDSVGSGRLTATTASVGGSSVSITAGQGGGGALGAGGGVFVGSNANVELTNIAFSSCLTQGGGTGTLAGIVGGGGGGMNLGNGGIGGTSGGGGGGFGAVGGNGAPSPNGSGGGGGLLFAGGVGGVMGGAGGGGSDENVGNNGSADAGGNGGQGTTGTAGPGGIATGDPGTSGTGNSGGGGSARSSGSALQGGNGGSGLGGKGGTSAATLFAAGGGGAGIGGGGGGDDGTGTGHGGTFGGGGGGGNFSGLKGGDGGFGGGGGGGSAGGSSFNAAGGIGGFGGGGGRGFPGGVGGFAAGAGTGSNGGGGAALGGAIFVSNGATLKLSGNINLNSGSHTITGGASTGNSGAAFGPDMFLMSSGTIEFAPNASTTVTIAAANPIESDQGAGGGSVTTGGLIMSGAGTLDLRGNTGATLPYTGSNSFNGGTTIISDDLNLGNNTTMAPLVSNPMSFNGGTLELATGFTTTSRQTTLNSAGGTIQSDTGVTASFSNTSSISGPGVLTKTGAGSLTLNGTNTYSGGTTISGGTLALGTTSFNASGFVNINGSGGAFDITGAGGPITIGDLSSVSGSNVNVGANTLTFGTANSTTFSGSFNGSGHLIKQNTGTFTLNGTNTFTGTFDVNAGTLHVASSGLLPAASTTNIAGGATLMGTGTLGIVNLNGTVIPSETLSSIGTLHTANFTFNNGSEYLVAVAATTSDLIASSGTVTINSGSTLLLSLLADPQLRVYTIITALGGVIDPPFTFINPYPRFNFRVQYDPNDVLLVLDSLNPFTASGNASGVAKCFTLLADNPPSDLADVVDILNFQSLSQWQDSFNQMQPADLNAIGLAQENVAERIRQIYSRHFLEQRVIACPQRQHWRFWASPFVEWVHQSGTSHLKGYKEDFAGVTAALDYQLRHWVFTGGFSYAGADVHVKGGRTKGDFNTYAGTIGAMWAGSGFFTEGLFSYLYSTADASRKMKFSVSTPTLSSSAKRKAKHSQDSNEMMGHLGCGYDFKFKQHSQHKFNLYPFIDVDYIYMDQDGFTEHGGRGLNLKVKEKSYDFLRPDAGIGFGYAGCLTNVNLLADASVSYAREFRFLGKKTKSSFEDEKDCHFTVRGLNPKNNLICPMASFGVSTRKNTFSFMLTYYGEYGEHFVENAGEIELKAAF